MRDQYAEGVIANRGARFTLDSDVKLDADASPKMGTIASGLNVATLDGGYDTRGVSMQHDQDLRRVLLAIRSLLASLSVTARSPNFDAMLDVVALALDDHAAFVQPIIALPEASLDAPVSIGAGWEQWLSMGVKSASRH